VIAAVWNNFKVFNRENAVNPAWSQLELDEKMATWVELKIGRGELSRTSPLTYVKKLEQIHRMLVGERSSLLTEHRRAIRRRTLQANLGACGPACGSRGNGREAQGRS
jgi:hypothetical protein